MPISLDGPVLPKFILLAFALLQLLNLLLIAGLSSYCQSMHQEWSDTFSGFSSLFRILLHKSARLNITPRAMTSFTNSKCTGALYSQVYFIYSAISSIAPSGWRFIFPTARSRDSESSMSSFLHCLFPIPYGLFV